VVVVVVEPSLPPEPPLASGIETGRRTGERAWKARRESLRRHALGLRGIGLGGIGIGASAGAEGGTRQFACELDETACRFELLIFGAQPFELGTEYSFG
jgi:hypothetical protein